MNISKKSFGDVVLYYELNSYSNIDFTTLNINWKSGNTHTTYQDAKDIITDLQKAVDHIESLDSNVKNCCPICGYQFNSIPKIGLDPCCDDICDK